jgi:hypothetical protein
MEESSLSENGNIVLDMAEDKNKRLPKVAKYR